MSALALPPGMRVLERGWLSANNIVFIGAERTAMVDSGYVSHAAQTLALVEHALDGRPLDLLLNTHLHSDHCGGNAALQARYGCATVIPVGEAAAVAAWDEAQLSYRATGQQCPRFSFSATIAPGDTLVLGDLHWQALGAPGHDPRSLLFYCARHAIVLSADALWENGFGVIFPELDGQSGFDEAAATLEMIAQLDVRLVIPGHGAPFTDVAGALQRARSRLDYLRADPRRNADNAVRVLLKFLLLERGQLAMAEVVALFEQVPVMVAARIGFLGGDADGAARHTAAALVRAGAARLDGAVLCNLG
ncbi:MBL fold metallo-hydrolase [Massilia sp. DWR3-1-1]|uniref:MBL fold metallo-hydrolase n=1 Tax=Massilia sp. DWR3-1-1 TaxID=2804559 RepID=UPI003CF92554